MAAESLCCCSRISDIIKDKTSRDQARTEQRQMERENLSYMRDGSLNLITSDPDRYLQYLDLQADNIRCSVGNVALTMAQLQGATRIGSTDYWHSQGRYVRDDAINAGATVFVPPRNKTYRGYFMGNYYDVSQTTGKPLPERTTLTDQDTRMMAALTGLMDQSPVTVAESRDIGAPALYDPDRLTIFIDPDHSATQVFAALSAEIALARAHDRGYNQSFKRELYALDAQSVGYMVCRRFGVECPPPELAAHVAGYYEGYPATNRGEALESVRATARKIGDGVEQTIAPRQQERDGSRHYRSR